MISTAFLAIVGAYAPTGPSRLPGTHALSTPPPQIAVHWPPGATALVALPIMAAARTPLAAQPAAPLTVLFNVFRFVQNMIVRAAARACLTAALLGLPLGLMGNMIGPPTAAYDMPSAVAISSQRTPAAPGASHVAEEVHNARRLMRGMAPTTIFRRRAEAVAADQLGQAREAAMAAAASTSSALAAASTATSAALSRAAHDMRASVTSVTAASVQATAHAATSARYLARSARDGAQSFAARVRADPEATAREVSGAVAASTKALTSSAIARASSTAASVAVHAAAAGQAAQSGALAAVAEAPAAVAAGAASVVAGTVALGVHAHSLRRSHTAIEESMLLLQAELNSTSAERRAIESLAAQRASDLEEVEERLAEHARRLARGEAALEVAHAQRAELERQMDATAALAYKLATQSSLTEDHAKSAVLAGHAAELTRVREEAERRRQLLTKLLGARRRRVQAALAEVHMLRKALRESEASEAAERDRAAAAVTEAAEVAEALAKAEASAAQLSSLAKAEASRADVERSLAALAQERVTALEATLARATRAAEEQSESAELSAMGVTAHARVASLQLELNSAREQAQEARRAQQAQAMSAARAAADAAAASAQLRQQLAEAEEAHAAQQMRMQVQWEQREAHFRADLQAAHTRREQELAAQGLQRAEMEAEKSELDAKLQAAKAAERAAEGALQQARTDAKAARGSAERYAGRAAKAEEALALANVELERLKHEIYAAMSQGDVQLLETDLQLKRTREQLAQERESRRKLAVDADAKAAALRTEAEKAKAALAVAHEEAAAVAETTRSQVKALETARRRAEAHGATLAAELERMQKRTEAAAAAAEADVVAAAAARTVAARESFQRERRLRSAAAARIDLEDLDDDLDEHLVAVANLTADALLALPAAPRIDLAPAALSAPALPVFAMAPSPYEKPTTAPSPYEKPTTAPSQSTSTAAFTASKVLPSSAAPTVVDNRRPLVPLTMLVRDLAQHISPMRLLDEFPTALSVEALYERRTGTRQAVVLSFDSRRPPTGRTSQALGCLLQPVVTPPKVSEATKRVVWKRTPATTQPPTAAGRATMPRTQQRDPSNELRP